MVDMKITHIHSPHPHRSGFVLLEVILALALFATVAVGMTNALDQMGRANRVGRQDAQVMRVLESVLSEVAHQPELKPKTFSFPLTDDRIGASTVLLENKNNNHNTKPRQYQRIFIYEEHVRPGKEGKRWVET
jgi:prepilin-type N-terminal cleavage/methylation domain-containing protein